MVRNETREILEIIINNLVFPFLKKKLEHILKLRVSNNKFYQDKSQYLQSH